MSKLTEVQIRNTGQELTDKAYGIEIATSDDYSDAVKYTKKCGEYKRFAINLYEDEKRKAWDLHKSLVQKQKILMGPFWKLGNQFIS